MLKSINYITVSDTHTEIRFSDSSRFLYLVNTIHLKQREILLTL